MGSKVVSAGIHGRELRSMKIEQDKQQARQCSVCGEVVRLEKAGDKWADARHWHDWQRVPLMKGKGTRS